MKTENTIRAAPSISSKGRSPHSTHRNSDLKSGVKYLGRRLYMNSTAQDKEKVIRGNHLMWQNKNGHPCRPPGTCVGCSQQMIETRKIELLFYGACTLQPILLFLGLSIWAFVEGDMLALAFGLLFCLAYTLFILIMFCLRRSRLQQMWNGGPVVKQLTKAQFDQHCMVNTTRAFTGSFRMAMDSIQTSYNDPVLYGFKLFIAHYAYVQVHIPPSSSLDIYRLLLESFSGPERLELEKMNKEHPPINHLFYQLEKDYLSLLRGKIFDESESKTLSHQLPNSFSLDFERLKIRPAYHELIGKWLQARNSYAYSTLRKGCDEAMNHILATNSFEDIFAVLGEKVAVVLYHSYFTYALVPVFGARLLADDVYICSAEEYKAKMLKIILEYYQLPEAQALAEKYETILCSNKDIDQNRKSIRDHFIDQLFSINEISIKYGLAKIS